MTVFHATSTGGRKSCFPVTYRNPQRSGLCSPESVHETWRYRRGRGSTQARRCPHEYAAANCWMGPLGSVITRNPTRMREDERTGLRRDILMHERDSSRGLCLVNDQGQGGLRRVLRDGLHRCECNQHERQALQPQGCLPDFGILPRNHVVGLARIQ
jgi:hypothetical protein